MFSGFLFYPSIHNSVNGVYNIILPLKKHTGNQIKSAEIWNFIHKN